MNILLYIALLIIGGLLNYLIKHKGGFVYAIAITYLCLMLLLCADYWLFHFADIRSAGILKTLSAIQAWGNSAGHLLLGYLIINILFALRDEDSAYPSQKITHTALWGVSIITANMFIMFTLGKAQNLCYMTAFFRSSGYALWFLYFIMAAETLGALGILLHFKFKTGIFSATGLMLIMIGVLYTHSHNRDPLSDSYDAIGQFITLAAMQVVYYFEKRVNMVEEALPGVEMV